MHTEHSSATLVGLAEVAALLGLSKPATFRRAQQADFPAPLAELAAGPVWDRADIVEYAPRRVDQFKERPAIEALAAEPTRYDPYARAETR
jgi:predicted DNA-binding transcriptional regulator AlpA